MDNPNSTDSAEKLGAALYPSMAKPPVEIPPGTPDDEARLRRQYPNSPELFATEKPKPKAPDPRLVTLYPTMHTREQRAAAESGPVDAAVLAQVTAWENEIRADPEIGGAELEGNLELARDVLRQYGGPDMAELLDAGLGSNPAVVRSFVRIGKALGRGRR
jgi:hypothetical protein